MKNKRKPDIEMGIAMDGTLHLWCNCSEKKKEGGINICERHAKIFTDTLSEALEGHGLSSHERR